MKISVVTIALNDEARIARSLKAMRRQTNPADEYIVIDGLSSDGTNDIIREYSDIVTTHLSERDSGIYDAMNKGLKRCTGDWLGIVNAGDFYFPWALKTIVEAARDSDADILHGDQMVFTTYESFSWFRIQQPDPDIAALERKPSILHPTCFVRRALYERIGYFDTSYKVDADYEFLLRAKRSGARFRYIPKLLTAFESGGVSGGCTRFSEGYRILRHYGIPRYSSNTVKLLRCLLLKVLGTVIDFDNRLEQQRLREAGA